MARRTAAYGSWKSPITPDLIVAETVGLASVYVDGDDILWIESRPMEAGRHVVVRHTSDGDIREITPPHWSARTRVHEYGGGAFVAADRVLFFSNDADQRLYRLEPGTTPRPITPDSALRFADGMIDRRHARIICVCEDHSVSGEPVNTIVAIDVAGNKELQPLVAGNAFYAAPRLSADGDMLAWLTWNHPDMPWDGTELWAAPLNADGSVTQPTRVAGSTHESIFQPEWSPDGALYFVSDRTGWWNLYRWHSGTSVPITAIQAEFGLPQWVFGMSTYAFASRDCIIAAYNKHGHWYLARIDTRGGELEDIETPYTYITSVRATPRHAVFLAASPSEAQTVVRLDHSDHRIDVLRRSTTVAIDHDYLSVSEEIAFPTGDDTKAHAFFYPPRNRDYVAPVDTSPPLIVTCHGGPTGAAANVLHLSTQYWTSRGFAVVSVNYRGSTGYGRAYREQLNGQWGIADIEDCINAARCLVSKGLVDAERVAISGGSAGGYTVLCALTFHDYFKAGASYYGVSDLETLATDTHKFESRYLDRLIGPYPEQRDLYRARSPIHYVDRLACPVIFFQGLEDRVVPPSQAERMVAALREKGIPVAYLAFAGEQHGFRQAQHIKAAMEAQLYFYGRVFGLELADSLEPVQIYNL
ncbi:MAG: S9 family peptidase [Acidiferrobacterales bacterium]